MRRARLRPSSVSIATRLAGAVVIVTFVALVAASFIGLRAGTDLGRDLYQDRLESLASSGAADTAGTLNSTERLTEVLALSPAATLAIEGFREGFAELPLDDPDFDGLAEARALGAEYAETYLETTTAESVPIEQILSENSGAIYLQSRYSVDDSTFDDPSRVLDAGDGSSWSDVHAAYHSAYRRTADSNGLSDVYLVDGETGRVVYSVAKRPDLGTSLRVGPYSGSVLADTVLEVIEDPAAGTVRSDLSPYDARPGEIVGVMASPVFDGETFVGAVATMYDGAGLTATLTGNGQWEELGIPETGDVYLVGTDGTTRSDPRGYLTDPTGFLDATETAGRLSADERAVIEARGTTVLTLVAIEGRRSSQDVFDDGVIERTSASGDEVISTAVPVTGSEWFVIAETQISVAEVSVDEFRNILIIGTATFIILVTFFAVTWARNLMRPVKSISERLGSSPEASEIEIPDHSPTEMHELARSFEEMASTLDDQQVALARARDDRLAAMREMLPPAVAERIASGDVDQLDHVERASVAVIVVLGLGDLVRSEAEGSNRALVDELNERLDLLALEHGVDRVKIVGDAYFAACGHDRPFIDHAPRVVAFAVEARQAVRSLGGAAHPTLDVASGVETGAVTVGMIGGSRLVYDVWGETVSTAHYLARRAQAGSVLLSAATHALLPEELADAAEPLGDEPTWVLRVEAADEVVR